MNSLFQQNLPTIADAKRRAISVDELISLFRKHSYKVQVGDEILFPTYEDARFVRQDVERSDGSIIQVYYELVLRNGKSDWIVVKVIREGKRPICTYSLTNQFNYPSSNLKELLIFLGDLERPITVHEHWITWDL